MVKVNMTIKAVLVEGSPATTTEPTTFSGIPVSMLWVPYVIFSILLITLICASFLRFHIKNGHKYQRRRAEMWRRLNVNKMQNFLNQLQSQVTGMSSSPPNGSTNNIEVTMPPSPSSVSPRQAQPRRKKRRKKNKLSYTCNTNGSMVDVRVTGSYGDNSLRSSSGSSIFTLAMAPGPPRKIINLTSKPLSIEAQEDEILLIEETL